MFSSSFARYRCFQSLWVVRMRCAFILDLTDESFDVVDKFSGHTVCLMCVFVSLTVILSRLYFLSTLHRFPNLFTRNTTLTLNEPRLAQCFRFWATRRTIHIRWLWIDWWTSNDAPNSKIASTFLRSFVHSSVGIAVAVPLLFVQEISHFR